MVKERLGGVPATNSIASVPDASVPIGFLSPYRKYYQQI